MRRSGPGVVVDLVALSDPGRDPAKQNNEDTFASSETPLGLLLVVCDGMGGHLGGREAAEAAVASIVRAVSAAPASTPRRQALREALVSAGRAVHAVGGTETTTARPGSTAVVALLHGDGLDLGHIGDSRAYVFRSDRLHPLTRDHSVVQAMIDRGELSPSAARGHPEANRITRALGIYAEAEPEVRPEPVRLYPGDVLLLATDGLTDMLADSDLEAALRQHLPRGVEEAARALVHLANAQGGWDNITIELAAVESTGSVDPTAVRGAAGAPPGAPGAGRTRPLAAHEPAHPAAASNVAPFPYTGTPTTTLPLGASLADMTSGSTPGAGTMPAGPPEPGPPPRRAGKIAAILAFGCAGAIVLAIAAWWVARALLAR